MKQKQKRILSVILALALVLGMCPGTLRTAAAATSGDYTYTVSNDEATITKYTGSGGDVTIPSTLGGYPVTSIGSWAFFECRSLTNITIPDSVTSIGICAFSGCISLTSIDVSAGNNAYLSEDGVLFNRKKTCLIQYPGGKAGAYVIPEGVTSIGEEAFYHCTGLTNIAFPDSITSIGVEAFRGCTSLTSITIPESVTNIEGLAFQDCTGLTSVMIPDSVTNIDGFVFSDCTSLASITIPGSVTSIGNSAFRGCAGLTSVTIPDSVTSIGNYAFSGCTGLTSVTFEGAASQIDGAAFSFYGVTATAWYYPTNTTWTSAARQNYGGTLTWKAIPPDGITVATLPAKTEYERNEALDTTGLTLTATYSDGSTATITDGYTISGFGSAEPGEKTVAVTYEGKTTTFTVTVKAPVLTDITVTTLPTKTEYERNEALDTTGLTLAAAYSDGSMETVTEGYTISYDFSSAGEKTVTVTYGDKTAMFTVKVYVPLSVSLIADANEFTPGSTVSLTLSAGGSGLIAISGTFTDIQGMRLVSVTSARSGWQVDFNGNSFTAYDGSMSNPVNEEETIFIATFQVNSDAVPDSAVSVGVTVTASNGINVYSNKDALWNGTIVGGFVTIYDSTYYIDADGSRHAGWLTLDGKRYFFDEQSNYLWHDRWKKSGSEWYLLGGDGAALTGWQDYLERRYYFDENGVMLTGQQEIDGEVYIFDEYGILQTDDLPEETIPLVGEYVRMYSYNDSDYCDLYREVISFSDALMSDLADGYADYDPNIDWEDVYCNFPPDACSFDQGSSAYCLELKEGWEIFGYIVYEFQGEKYYAGGANGGGAGAYVRRGNRIYTEWETYEITENGLKVLNEYDDPYCNNRVYIYGDATTYLREDVTSISLDGAKEQYRQGEEIDVSELSLTVNYTSGWKMTITEDLTLDYDFSTPGEKKITVTWWWGSETTDFTVTVLPVLTGITVASLPAKAEYECNEVLNTAGLTITATYSDGSTQTITSGYTVSEFDSATAGSKTVTVTYEGMTATFNVTVKAATIPAVGENDRQAVVESKTARPGETVELTVTLKNADPVRSIAASDISYDTSAMTLTSVKWADKGAVMKQWDSEKGKGALSMGSVADLNGTVMTMTFAVKDDTAEGEYAIGLNLAANSGTGNEEVAVIPGTLTVRNYMIGDLDGDETVTDADAIYLLMHSFFPEDYPVNQPCDYDGDGEITDADAIYLLMYTFFPEDYPIDRRKG